MKKSKQEVQERMARFKRACRDAGIKLTHQRLEIFKEAAQTENHPDAEAISKGVRKCMPTVSMDTVYRTLWMLNDLGLIKTLGPNREGRFSIENQFGYFIQSQIQTKGDENERAGN